ncbi:MAG TPA: hypothetical protein VK213_07410 [Bacteroidales bacterium]|nr:hypothetical protein [Bacteroidales bacterium]
MIVTSNFTSRLKARRLLLLILMAGLTVLCISCATGRKNQGSLESLMLQENVKLRINREYYSRHNIKTKRDAYRKYRKHRRR